MHEAHPGYPVAVPEMLRFGILHNRSVAVPAGSSSCSLGDDPDHDLGWSEPFSADLQ